MAGGGVEAVNRILATLFGVLVCGVVLTSAHTVYVSQMEFQPATARFNKAIRNHDQAGMDAALDDEQKALERESFMWWWKP